ncbi:MAG: cupin domain-containing protein [Planktomarina sp.]
MKSIKANERRVANIYDDAAFSEYDPTGENETGTSFIKLNTTTARDVGFYIYRMEPGAASTPHSHGGAEEFVMIEGELIDNDGTAYKQGDVVWLAPGTEHTSHTETGCLIAVYAEASEEILTE